MDDAPSDADEEVEYEALQRSARRRQDRERAELETFLAWERRCNEDPAPSPPAIPPRKATPTPVRSRPRAKPAPSARDDETTALKAEIAALENELTKAAEEQKRLRMAKKRLERQLSEAEAKVRSVEAGQEEAKAELERWAETKRAEIRKAQKKLEREKEELATQQSSNSASAAVEAELDALRATVERLKVAGDEKHKKSLAKQAALREKLQAQDLRVRELEGAVAAAERAQLEAAKPQRRKPEPPPAPEEEEELDDEEDLDEDEPDDVSGPPPPPWRVVRDGIKERVFPNGKREVVYKNGTTKTVEGDLVEVRFVNGDVKKTDAKTGKVVYFYADARTTHTTDPADGVDIFEFPNGQVERHNKDGSKDIRFPDGTRKIVDPDGRSQTRFPDGVVIVNDDPGQ